MLYWFLKTIVVGPVVRVTFRPWVEGEENVPETGGVIFASNHLSFSDSIFLPLVVSRKMTFPAKMEYFTGTGVKGWLSRRFFTGVGQIPIDRSGGQASLAALNAGLKVLRRGEVFGIYPEGTRSPDGRLYKGKTGVARLALEARVPVVPVAMIDTDKAQPTGKVIPNVHRVGIKFGKPLDFSRYEGLEEDRFVLRSITDEIMYELMALSGQEYVDEYASSVKERVAAAARGAVDQAKAGLEQARTQVEHAAGQVASHVREGVEQVRDQVSGTDRDEATDDTAASEGAAGPGDSGGADSGGSDSGDSEGETAPQEHTKAHLEAAVPGTEDSGGEGSAGEDDPAPGVDGDDADGEESSPRAG